jgi:hypothetical protein
MSSPESPNPAGQIPEHLLQYPVEKSDGGLDPLIHNPDIAREVAAALQPMADQVIEEITASRQRGELSPNRQYALLEGPKKRAITLEQAHYKQHGTTKSEVRYVLRSMVTDGLAAIEDELASTPTAERQEELTARIVQLAWLSPIVLLRKKQHEARLEKMSQEDNIRQEGSDKKQRFKNQVSEVLESGIDTEKAVCEIIFDTVDNGQSLPKLKDPAKLLKITDTLPHKELLYKKLGLEEVVETILPDNYGNLDAFANGRSLDDPLFGNVYKSQAEKNRKNAIQYNDTLKAIQPLTVGELKEYMAAMKEYKDIRAVPVKRLLNLAMAGLYVSLAEANAASE